MLMKMLYSTVLINTHTHLHTLIHTLIHTYTHTHVIRYLLHMEGIESSQAMKITHTANTMIVTRAWDYLSGSFVS